jgi:transcription termination factor NusB
MAWPWLTVAVKTIPWATLVRRAPDIIDAAASLLGSRKAGQSAEHAAARTESQLGELQERLDNLESHDQETAKVVNQIAEQTRDLTDGMSTLAAKVRLLSVLLVATAILAIIAIGIAAL